ncbi:MULTISPECIES: YheT family hydrolase [unclassified Wenzhouxiangella]|uniref:YheT family hydrolase n=1 Tax=unclassified Wenzhouxiangella TaxID=2613841 RepID=UPI0015F270EC|nr:MULTISPECIES: alpha/beta fold hydrolase [unclassified Wenzhouxiangella]
MPSFEPRGLLASPHMQSILTSGPWRRRKVRKRAAEYLSRCIERIVTANDGTRLLGFANRAQHGRRDALVIMLHGWEGSADSNYLLSTAVTLDGAGFDTFRLNFRDHGDSHHLNEGLFHSCLLDEVLDVVATVAGEYDGPVFLAGFSLGGNFTLRIARHAPERGLDIRRAIAVSPVIRPHHVLDAMEQGLPIYERYFVHKWRRSLKHKQSLFPERYNLKDWFRLGRVRAQTEWLIERLTDFEDLDAYLEGYSVAGDYLAGLETSTLIITAADDPIIPVRDFEALPHPAALDIEVLPHGGHCGFLTNWRLDSWIEQRLKSELCRLIKT